jgi:hypothetical protein
MRSVRVGSWFALCLTLLAVVPVAAAEKPVNISIFTPISLAKAEDGVTAFRFNLIYGRNTSVKVIDVGLINQTTTLSSGLQWGGLNMTEGATSGIQLGGINFNKGTTKGLQLAAGVNYAANAGGLQLALINYAEKIDGFQIGAINIIKEGGFLPVMIIANWSKKK